jgi:hypothetical protein
MSKANAEVKFRIIASAIFLWELIEAVNYFLFEPFQFEDVSGKKSIVIIVDM